MPLTAAASRSAIAGATLAYGAGRRSPEATAATPRAGAPQRARRAISKSLHSSTRSAPSNLPAGSRTKPNETSQASPKPVALPNSRYTNRVVGLAVRLVIEDGMPYRPASWRLWRDHRVFVPFATIQNWVEAAGKKSGTGVERDYLDAALKHFSGYIAVDELYDGPFCVLSIVDNRTFRRLVFDVLEANPTKADVVRFLRHFWSLLLRRGLSVEGITTDGSPLYPEPIATVFGAIPHQVCEFHVVKDITHAILRAVAKVRKQIAAETPQLPRGRPPRGEGRRLARRKARGKQKIADLFAHRYLFVRKNLTPEERATLARITRGVPALRPLRAIMEEVYRLFDRRCRTETALAKLANLRRRVTRFRRLRRVLGTLFAPGIEKALTFLDDTLLPSTANAVERGNRRHRKMQRAIYRTRTRENLVGRMALDLRREQRPSHARDPWQRSTSAVGPARRRTECRVTARGRPHRPPQAAAEGRPGDPWTRLLRYRLPFSIRIGTSPRRAGCISHRAHHLGGRLQCEAGARATRTPRAAARSPG